jgi:hypothetical protein
VQTCEDGSIVFDDTVLDKRYAQVIEMSQRQYSGCEQMSSATLRGRVIRGIGLVSCLYVNADTRLVSVEPQ